MKWLITTVLSLVLSSTAICAQQNIVIVFDGSGSMGDRFSHDRSTRKIEAAKKALTTLLSAVPSNTNLGIVCFSGNINGWAYKLGPLDKKELERSINDIVVGGGTPLGKYMKIGANALLELRTKQKSGSYRLIIVTDGVSDDNVDEPLMGKYGILSKGIQVEVIGVDMSGRHTLATKVPYRSADNAVELKNAVEAVLAESTGQNDHSEDYDLIAPLPTEIATVALQALSEYDNTPIGEKPKAVPQSRGTGSGGIPTWVIVIGTIAAVFVGFIVICVVSQS